MTSHDALCALDELISARSILRHPFYLAWAHGELTSRQLTTYACVYYPHVAAFPDYLSNAIRCTSNELTRRSLEENLADELTNPMSHPELWLDFAEGVGASRTLAKSATRLGNTAATVSTFNRLTSKDSITGLAALYSYESQQPAVALEKMRGLRSFYGMNDDKTLAYFSVHATTDVAHCAAERAGLARCLRGDESLDNILEAADESLDAYWHLLDGVMEEAEMEYCANW